jgi:hypothetical protein
VEGEEGEEMENTKYKTNHHHQGEVKEALSGRRSRFGLVIIINS